MACDSGTIALDGDTICYRSRAYGNWDLPLASVRVIGEATNQYGPFADDYFLCFATGPGPWQEASFYAAGRDEFLEALSRRIECPLELHLCNSTDFASRVLWPPELAGQPMFRFSDAAPRTWLGRLFGSLRHAQTYSDAVAALLAAEPADLV